MRFLTFRDESGQHVGVLEDGRIFDVSRLLGTELQTASIDMLALIEAGAPAIDQIRRRLSNPDRPEPEATSLDAVEVMAPIPRPRKNIFCVGRNYREHAIESFRAVGKQVRLSESPNIFTKAVTTVNGPYADIPFDPVVSEQVDWEVELAVVIGVGGRHLRKEEALTHVFGYTVLNDVTARDIQHRPGIQWFQGKSLDGFCPMGPVLVTADEINDPQRLRLQLEVNGIPKQDSSTSLMLFDVATLIAHLSEVLTLEPGDIIATGTPDGVGFARTPPEFLHPGDLMETSIEGIGTMRNRVVQVQR
jgi:2-keto-4-pentenoate hydratase/2-oxohepta-3-ene-1,7-dioic acid hydratase in catechol pathway